MEHNKIKIAITQGDINGVGYEMILKTFAEPEMLDICTPIIYGAKKAALFHAKTLGVQCQFNFIDKAEDAEDGKTNLLKCSEEDFRVEFGSSTEASAKAAALSQSRAASDLQAKLVSAMVCSPMEESPSDALKIYTDGTVRAMFMDKTCADAIDSEAIAARIRLLHKCLRRDFRVSNPRIAVVTDKDDDRKDIITASLKQLFSEGIQAFGPYSVDTFTEHTDRSIFNGVLSVSTLKPEDGTVALLAGTPEVCVSPNTTAQYDIAGKGIADESAMRNAIYLAIDACRFRREYDMATVNPLQKLYKERPDSGEKMRFSIPKKKEE